MREETRKDFQVLIPFRGYRDMSTSSSVISDFPQPQCCAPMRSPSPKNVGRVILQYVDSLLFFLLTYSNRLNNFFRITISTPQTQLHHSTNPKMKNRSFIQRMHLSTVNTHRMVTWNVPIRPLLTEICGRTVVGFVLVLELADVWHTIS